MARRYQARICHQDVCKDVGKATASLDKAKKRMKKAMDKAAKRKFKKPPAGTIVDNEIHGEVRVKERGKVVEGVPPAYVGLETYGEIPAPGAGRRHDRRRRAPQE